MEKKDKYVLAHIPYELWLKLRRMQEEGRIKSLQEAVVKGLEWLTREEK